MNKKENKFCGCLYYSANALSRIITKMGEEAFNKSGLSPSYAFLLMIVNDKQEIQPKEISEIMQLQPSTVTRLVDKMVNKNFVIRKSVGKINLIYPTEKSLEINDLLRDCWVNLYKNYVDVLGEEFSKKLTSEIYDSYLKLQEKNI